MNFSFKVEDVSVFFELKYVFFTFFVELVTPSSSVLVSP